MLDFTSKQKETVTFHYQCKNVVICKIPWQILIWQLNLFAMSTLIYKFATS